MKLFDSDNMMQSTLIVIAIALVVYLVWQYLNDNNSNNNGQEEIPEEDNDVVGNDNNGLLDNVVDGNIDTEDGDGDVDFDVNVAGVDSGVSAGMQGVSADVGGVGFELGNVQEGFAVNPAEAAGMNAGPKALAQMDGVSGSQLPAECFPKDVLSSADLLPMDANSKFAQVAPSGQGSLQDKNFINAGFHVGSNTVGSSLRNANRQLRSDPYIPKKNVGPFQQSTIEADVSRLPLEIGSA